MKLVSVMALLVVSATATAGNDYLCKNGTDERKISVVYTQPGFTVPCEVVYEKADGMQTLWRANNQEGYCEEKAKAFAEKQLMWGYECSMNEDASSVNAN